MIESCDSARFPPPLGVDEAAGLNPCTSSPVRDQNGKPRRWLVSFVRFIGPSRPGFGSLGLFAENYTSSRRCCARYQRGGNLTTELNPISKAGCSRHHSRGRKSGFRSHVTPRAPFLTQIQPAMKRKRRRTQSEIFTQLLKQLRSFDISNQ